MIVVCVGRVKLFHMLCIKGLTMYLIDATNEEIKTYALSKGYIFSDDDCQELINGAFEGETLREAIDDYLSAFER